MFGEFFNLEFYKFGVLPLIEVWVLPLLEFDYHQNHNFFYCPLTEMRKRKIDQRTFFLKKDI